MAVEIDYAPPRRRWRWWDTLFLLVIAISLGLLLQSFVRPTWGIFDMRVEWPSR